MRAGATLSGLKWHGNDSYHTQLHLVSQRKNGLKLLHSKIAFQAPRSKAVEELRRDILAFYVIRKFIIVSTRVRHQSLSWAT
jgi:hypothetical protein